MVYDWMITIIVWVLFIIFVLLSLFLVGYLIWCVVSFLKRKSH